MKFPVAHLALAFAASTFLSLTLAAEAATDTPTRIEDYSIEYTINADGSFTEERTGVARVLKQSAIESSKHFSVGYSTSIQIAEVLEAYTLKPDGRRVEVRKDNFQISANSGRGDNAPAFSDRTTMSWVFPDLEVGDAVVSSYRIVAKEPMFAGHFSTTEIFSRSYPFDKVRIRISWPESMWTQFDARQLKEVRNETKKGRRLMEWSFSNPEVLKNERRDYSVYDPSLEAGIAFSTFRDYAAIAAAYSAVSHDKAEPTPRIRKLADEIAGEAREPRAVAHALYEWVATKVNYAGNCIGLGAVVPRDLDFVLDNRIGDCKDHATLLQALLVAKGIENTQALVNAGSTYTLPKVPVVSMVNHVINYIPSMDLYLDSTSDSTPFGLLPESDIGKPVLLVDGYRNGTRTPVPAIGSNSQQLKSEITVGPDGSMKIDFDVTLRGIYAVVMRSMFRNYPEDDKAGLVKNYLSARDRVGTGTVELDDAKALSDEYHYQAHLEIEEVLATGAGAFPIAPPFFSAHPVADFASANMQVEEQDVACWSGHSSEELVYRFPPGFEILSLPDDLKLSNDFLSYEATHVRAGDTLTVTRTFDDRTPGRICSPALMKKYKDFVKPVAANLKSQVLYKLPDSEAE